MKLTGVVEAGVELKCLMLNGYNIYGNDLPLQPGDHVTVEGEITEGVITICMQGTPFRVDRYEVHDDECPPEAP